VTDSLSPRMKDFQKFTHQGREFVFLVDQDCDGDCCKLWHTVVTPAGVPCFMDWSPYSNPTLADVLLWIDLGMPARTTGFPLDGAELRNLATARAAATAPQPSTI